MFDLCRIYGRGKPVRDRFFRIAVYSRISYDSVLNTNTISFLLSRTLLRNVARNGKEKYIHHHNYCRTFIYFFDIYVIKKPLQLKRLVRFDGNFIVFCFCSFAFSCSVLQRLARRQLQSINILSELPKHHFQKIRHLPNEPLQ